MQRDKRARVDEYLSYCFPHEYNQAELQTMYKKNIFFNFSIL